MLAGGAVPLIKLDKKIDSVYDIAMELAQKNPLLVGIPPLDNLKIGD